VAAGGADTSHADLSTQDCEIGSNVPNLHIPGSGMSHPGFPHRNAESSQDSGRARQGQGSAESIRASQGKLPKILFLSFSSEDP
jgi:hypothetical protein